MSARKPDHQRVRRAEPDIPWTDIPAVPPKGRVPKPPSWALLGADGQAWWQWAWKLPVANQWGPEDHAVAARRAELEDTWKSGDSRVLAEMRHLEVALGMTAKARRELRWRFVNEAGDVVEENGEVVPDDEIAARRAARAKRAG